MWRIDLRGTVLRMIMADVDLVEGGLEVDEWCAGVAGSQVRV